MNDLIIRWRNNKDFLSLIKITKYSFPGIRHMPYLLFPTIVAERNSQVVGFIVTDNKKEIGKILLMAVAKEYRGQKVGEELLKNFFAHFKKRGKKYCSTKVRINNLKALQFYQKNGFEVQAILKRIILGDVFILKKELL